jgi:glucokinase
VEAERVPPQLVADLGATNARFALARNGRLKCARIYPAGDFRTPLAAIRHYIAELPAGERPASGALAVAAPIVGGQVRFVNLGWSFGIERLKNALGFNGLKILNDLAAQAYALPALAPGSCRRIGGGRALAGNPMLAIGPGTGLGMAGLIPAKPLPHVVAGEGGHATLAAPDAETEQVLALLRGRYGHVSAERALSGPGLTALYWALAKGRRKALPLPSPAEVARAAETKSDPVAIATAHLFSRLLGGYCGDMALAFGALGGVYLVGGVVPGLGRAFDARAFRRAFEDKGRYREYLARVPVAIAARNDLGLKGLAVYLQGSGSR